MREIINLGFNDVYRYFNKTKQEYIDLLSDFNVPTLRAQPGWRPTLPHHHMYMRSAVPAAQDPNYADIRGQGLKYRTKKAAGPNYVRPAQLKFKVIVAIYYEIIILS